MLLAFDWAAGAGRPDFLGFAIRRTPGFAGATRSWLPNRVGFDGPAPHGGDIDSNIAPIQKFMWWDARIDDSDRGREFTYDVVPVVGAAANPETLDAAKATVTVTLPQVVTQGVGSFFNRAVVSSQAFVKEFGHRPTGTQLVKALEWLSNGMADGLSNFIKADAAIDGAIYHLTDKHWVFPAFAARTKPTRLVYEAATSDKGANTDAVDTLTAIDFKPRTKTKIMHDKFLVHSEGDPVRVQMGSANFTTEGLTLQANVVHTIDSPKLAQRYFDRVDLLAPNPALGDTATHAGWSKPIAVGGGKVRVFFPPEPKTQRESIDTIVDAVKGAHSSALFCIFDPTDNDLLDALFAAGDAGKMMFGLVNHVDQEAETKPLPGDLGKATVSIFHRSRDRMDVYDYNAFRRDNEPAGFWWEVASLPGVANSFQVFIHHKFVLVDAETDAPTIYTGSANMSNNSMHNNDENLLEIKGDTALARTYLAEFMRLYEHYRARALWQEHPHKAAATFKLRKTSSWATRSYTAGTPEATSRVTIAGSRE